MSLPSLPDECLSDVLSFLDNKSLYKCLFVNRYYCKLSIPIIWKEPFRPIYVKPKFPLVVNTLLTCLNEDEISSLIPYKIDFPNDQSPLFEYGKFVKKIDQDFVKQNIIAWLNPSSDVDKCQDCRVQKLTDVIYHMIMRQGSNLYEFNLNVLQNVFYVDLPRFSTFITFNPGITDLRSLNMEIDLANNDDVGCQNTIEFLSMVPRFCHNINNCDLWIFKLNSTFVQPFLDIIKLQPLVRMLICIVNVEENVKQIIYALEFRSETLKELLFECLDFQDIDLSFISKLECLETLKFIHCKGFVSQHYETLSKKKFQLKELKLWDGELGCFYNDYDSGFDDLDLKLNFVKEMVNSLGGKSLYKLSLNIVTLETIKAVKESCSNISFLHIKIFSGEFLDLIIGIICEMSSLIILNIQIGSYRVNSGLLVETLGNYLTSVKYLFLNFSIDLSSFEYFTNNCKANLKKFIIPDNKYLREGYLICVNNYQRIHKSLKLLGIEEFDWSNKELEIIASLKNQNIDIISSRQLLKLFY